MQELFQQIITRYESENGFAQNYKDLPVEQLELMILDFQTLYVFEDPDIEREDLIPFEDWLVFGYWKNDTQSEFLTYLAAKIANHYAGLS